MIQHIQICAFQFELNIGNKNDILKCCIYPKKKNIEIKLNNYIIGGEIYNLPQKKYYITRLTNKNKDKKNTNIIVKCIDDNSKNKICLKMVDDIYINIYIDTTPNQSARTYATLIIEPTIDIKRQEKLVEDFNNYLEEQREKYNSLFLTNYRESKDIARKRISFDLVYSIVNYLLD